MNDKIIYLDDLPFNFNEQETQMLLEQIPKEISLMAKQYGYHDSVFRDKLFEYIIEEKLKYESVEDYYNSDIAKNWFEKNEKLSNDLIFGKTEKFTVKFEVVFVGNHGTEIKNSGTFGLTTISLEKAWKNAFVAVFTELAKDGYVIKSLTIKNIK